MASMSVQTQGLRWPESTRSHGIGTGRWAEVGKGELKFAPTWGRRWGSRSHSLPNPGTWGFHGTKRDSPFFLYGGPMRFLNELFFRSKSKNSDYYADGGSMGFC
jgi:hypothetical protein